MEINIQVVDIVKQLHNAESAETPTVMLSRKPSNADNHVHFSSAESVTTGTWWVLNNAVQVTGQDLDWSHNQKSPQIRVPMFRYLLVEQSAEVLMQFGMQLAALVIACGRLKLGKEPRKMFVALSNAFERSDGKPGYAVYVGIAFLE